jgi:hypothetical protein
MSDWASWISLTCRLAFSFLSFFPRCQVSALLSAAAELNEDYLEEATLYALFRQAQQPKKKK